MREKNIDDIYDLYFKRVYFYVKRIIGDLGNEADIEECVSDVFLEIWKHGDKFDSSRGSFDTFVNVKTRSIALNYRKRLMNHNAKYETENIEYAHIPESEILNTENRVMDKIQEEYVLCEIKKFKEPNRTYFYLRYFMNYDIKTIAKMFNTTISAVDNRLYRCRLSLQKTLRRERV